MSLPTYKEIFDLIKKGATLEAQEKIMELRETALNLQEENLGLREKVSNLEDEIKLKKQMVFENTVYYQVEGKNKNGPFCQRCYDVDKKIVHLQDYGREWFCIGCERGYRKK